MNLELSGIGADRKKIAVLGGLALLLGYFVYSNVIAPSDDTPRPQARTAQSAQPAAPPAFGVPAPETRPRSARAAQKSTRLEFKMETGEKAPDPAAIDPTLRLDLLSKVQSVNLEGGERSLFQFSAAPLPKTPEPRIIPNSPKTAAAAAAAMAINKGPAAPPKPPPPNIPLAFYGLTVRGQEKRVFFLDGDEIVVATEGQVIKKRYKVVRIGINSVTVEDLEFQNQQTLVLQDQPPEQFG
jgi:hypothetical protein